LKRRKGFSLSFLDFILYLSLFFLYYISSPPFLLGEMNRGTTWGRFYWTCTCTNTARPPNQDDDDHLTHTHHKKKIFYFFLNLAAP
jgi:hypothetical protein